MRALLFIALSLISFGALAADNPAAPTATDIRPLMVGLTAPDVGLVDPDGNTVRLLEAAAEKPLVLVFYRGAWCPICQRQLAQLEKELGDWQATGFQIYAVAQDSPEVNAGVVRKQNLSFPVLADKGLAAARAFGLAFRVDEGTVSKYKDYGIDLQGLYGSADITVPAIYLIGRDGKVLFNYVNPDYRVRLEPSVLMAAMKAHQ